MSRLTIKEIKERLVQVTSTDDAFYQSMLPDSRAGVQTLLASVDKRLAKQQALKNKLKEMSLFEKQSRQKGYQVIAGIDEVGRGPLAGPVVAAAVVLPEDFDVLEINDSKQLSETKRDILFDKIQEQALSIGVGIISPAIIDQVNIYQATKQAMEMALTELDVAADFLLIDAMTLDNGIPQESIVKGDTKSVSIACASIIAKVTRDRLMKDYNLKYPGYDFGSNAGYGTANHLAGLKKLGVTPIHRRSFEPIKSMVAH